MLLNLNTDGLNTQTDDGGGLRIIKPAAGSSHLAGDKITFKAIGADELFENYYWDFGDGCEGEGQEITHTYTSTITPTVSVTALVMGEYQTVSIRIYIIGDPEFEIVKPHAGDILTPLVQYPYAITYRNYDAPIPITQELQWTFPDKKESDIITLDAKQRYNETAHTIEDWKKYRKPQEAKVIATVTTTALGKKLTATREITITIGIAPWIWIPDGKPAVCLADINRFFVLADGITGFSDTTEELTKDLNPARRGEIIYETANRAREVAFNLLILGTNREDIMQKRRELLDAFAIPGKLIVYNNDYFILNARSSRGSPGIADGTPPANFATVKQASIRLTAVNPYFYSIDAINIKNEEIFTVIGNAPAPITMTVTANECTMINTKTKTKIILYSDASKENPIKLSVTDEEIKATDKDGKDAIGRFSYLTQYALLEPDTEMEVTGIESLSYTPRWNGI